MIVRELTTKLNFESDERKIDRSISKLQVLAGAFAGITAAAAVARTVAFNFASAAGSYGDEVAKTARQLGMTVEGFQSLRFAFDRSGVSAEAFQRSMQRLNREIGQDPDEHRTIEELLPVIADEFRGMESAAERAALAQQLFGRSGQGMVLGLIEGSDGLRELQNEFERLGGGISQEQAEMGEGFVDAMTNFRVAMSGVRMQLGMLFLPSVQASIEAITEVIVRNRDSIIFILNQSVVYLSKISHFLIQVVAIFLDKIKNRVGDLLKTLGDTEFITRTSKTVAEVLSDILFVLAKVVDFVGHLLVAYGSRINRVVQSLGGWEMVLKGIVGYMVFMFIWRRYLFWLMGAIKGIIFYLQAQFPGLISFFFILTSIFYAIISPLTLIGRLLRGGGIISFFLRGFLLLKFLALMKVFKISLGNFLGQLRAAFVNTQRALVVFMQAFRRVVASFVTFYRTGQVLPMATALGRLRFAFMGLLAGVAWRPLLRALVIFGHVTGIVPFFNLLRLTLVLTGVTQAFANFRKMTMMRQFVYLLKVWAIISLLVYAFREFTAWMNYDGEGPPPFLQRLLGDFEIYSTAIRETLATLRRIILNFVKNIARPLVDLTVGFLVFDFERIISGFKGVVAAVKELFYELYHNTIGVFFNSPEFSFGEATKGVRQHPVFQMLVTAEIQEFFGSLGRLLKNILTFNVEGTFKALLDFLTFGLPKGLMAVGNILGALVFIILPKMIADTMKKVLAIIFSRALQALKFALVIISDLVYGSILIVRQAVFTIIDLIFQTMKTIVRFLKIILLSAFAVLLFILVRLRNLGAFLGDWFEVTLTAIKNFVINIQNFIEVVLVSTIQGLQNLNHFVKTFIQALFDTVGQFGSSIISFVGSIFSGIFEVIRAILPNFLSNRLFGSEEDSPQKEEDIFGIPPSQQESLSAMGRAHQPPTPYSSVNNDIDLNITVPPGSTDEQVESIKDTVRQSLRENLTQEYDHASFDLDKI